VSLVRLLLAWSWLRWRALVNALAGKRRSGGGVISAWLSLVLTITLSVVALVWAVGLSIGAWIAGRSIALGDGTGPGLVAIRIVIGVLTVVLLIFAVLAGGRSATSDWTRLLLLPIARRDLQAMELLAGLGDPWLLLVLPPLAVVALTMAPRFGAMAIAALGGLLLFVALGALTTLLSLLVQLLLRNRRRAEVIVFVTLVTMMTLGWLPGLIMRVEDGDARTPRAVPTQAQPASPGNPTSETPPPFARNGRANDGAAPQPNPWRWFPGFLRAVPTLLTPVPSELYARALSLAAEGRPSRAAIPLAALAVEVVLLCSFSAVAWRRLVESPAVGSRRRRGLALPRLAAPASPAGHPAVAVARAQVATSLRTVQGRLAVVSPVLIVGALSLTNSFRGASAFAGVAPLLGATAVLALGPLSMLGYQNVLLNQFGNDGAGFSLQVLSPLSERTLIAGRALGGAALVLLAFLPALLTAMLLHPSTPPLLWPATLFGAAAAYLIFAPAALALSLLFPKAADLSKLGRKGKPHGAAAVGGMFAVGIAFGFVQGLGAVGFLVGKAAGVLLAEALLAAVALGIAWPLLMLVAQALPARRDALLLAARGD
jgi:hypothetical protein